MISVENLTKDYYFHEKPLDFLRPLLGKPVRAFRALNDISFKVQRGEVLGIIGSNGAGKSTLLKILSGIYFPTTGKVCISGPSSAILELSTGFHQQMSGRENIRRRLLLHGCSKSEIRKLEPEIIDFAEVEDVIEQDVQTYSTGMAARLAFAIVTASPSEVLFIDEILAVGDEHFQGKSLRRIKNICASGRTVVMVSHGINYVESLCDKAIWLDRGRLKMSGDAHSVGMAYLGVDSRKVDASYPRKFGKIQNVRVIDSSESLIVETTIDRYRITNDLHIQIAVHDNRYGMLAALYNSSREWQPLPAGLGPVTIKITSPTALKLRKGLIGIALVRGTGAVPGSIVEDSWGWDNGRQIYFSFPGNNVHEYYLNMPLRWNLCL